MTIIPILLALSIIILFIWFKWSNDRVYKMLKDIPGPFIIPFLGSVFFLKLTSNTNLISRLANLNRTYGPHTKLFVGKTPIIVISDPTDNKIFLNHPRTTHKPEIIYHDLKLALGNGLITANGIIWQNHRKILSKTFNAIRINNSVEVLQKGVEELIISLSAATTTKIDLESVIYKKLLIINTEFFFCYGMEDPNKWTNIAEIIKRTSEIVALKMLNPLFKIDYFFNLTRTGKEFSMLLLQANKFAEEGIEKVRLEFRNGSFDSHNNSVADILLSANCSKQDVCDEVLTFTAANTDTSTMTISISLVLLALNPAIQDKLFEEILDVLGPTGKTDTENIKHLKYLEMVVLETLRLYPVAPFFARQNPCDVQLSNLTIPANTPVMTNIFSMQRNEEYWPDPLCFKPERFSPGNSANRNPNAFMPFAVGPRMCPGAKYATLLIMVVLANIIQRYKVSTAYKSVEDIQLSYGLGIRLLDGTKCTLEERKLV